MACVLCSTWQTRCKDCEIFAVREGTFSTEQFKAMENS
jgi:hypothetical protein